MPSMSVRQRQFDMTAQCGVIAPRREVPVKKLTRLGYMVLGMLYAAHPFHCSGFELWSQAQPATGNSIQESLDELVARALIELTDEPGGFYRLAPFHCKPEPAEIERAGLLASAAVDTATGLFLLNAPEETSI
jgi:hypothetical protein